MDLINRRQTRVLVIAAILIAIMVPVTLMKSESISREWNQHRESGRASSAITTVDGSVNGDAQHRNHFPEARDRSLAADDEIVVEFPETRAQSVRGGSSSERREQAANPTESAVATSEIAAPRQESQSESSESRSAVGWSSGSFTNYQPEQRIAPTSLQIPSLSINAQVNPVGKELSGAMEVPDDRDTVGWYKYGPSPGEPGSAVIAGHLDDASGRSIFFDLNLVAVGASITIAFEDGTDKEFRVVEKVAYDSTSLPGQTMFARDGDPRLALITCGGEWDRAAGRYTKTVVVYAEPTTN